MNKSLLTSLAAAAAMSLTAFAYGAPPDPNRATEMPPAAPADQAVPPETSPSQSAGSVNSSTQLEGLVPQGMSTQQACSGFSSVSDCALTLRVAQNLQISFPDLKSRLASGQAITAAITEMKPGADAQAELQKAASETDGIQ